MRIDNTRGNNITIWNCGKGEITNASLKVYIDDVLIRHNLSSSIAENGRGDIIIPVKEQVQYKEHNILVSNGATFAQTRSNVGNVRILAIGDVYSNCNNGDFWTDYYNPSIVPLIPDNYSSYDILYLKGDASAGVDATDSDRDKIRNFLSSGKDVYVTSAGIEIDGMSNDDWFPGTSYGGSAGNYTILDSTHSITIGYSGNYGGGSANCQAAGYNSLKTNAGDRFEIKALAMEAGCGMDTYTTIIGKYKRGKIVWDEYCMVDKTMFYRVIDWLSPWSK